MNAVEFSGVSLARGGRIILRNLDFAIGAGEFIAVLGPNGAGKTSLFRSVLGLLAPVKGQISIFGKPAVRAKMCGMMPQMGGETGPGHLSGRAFVAAAAAGNGWGLPWLSQPQRNDVDRVITLVEAGDYAHRRMDHLSGGQRQRLMLAQALLGGPKLLLLDEMLAGLDVRWQAATMSLISQLHRELGVTVLLSAHDASLVIPMADRVLCLGSGEAAIGAVDKVMTAPVLSRLYGTRMEVIRAQKKIFVIPADPETASASSRGVAHVCV